MPDSAVAEDQESTAVEGQIDPVGQLERLAKLRLAEAITETEFEEAKKRLLDRL